MLIVINNIFKQQKIAKINAAQIIILTTARQKKLMEVSKKL